MEMIKKLSIAFIFMFAANLFAMQLEGDYYLGNEKVSIIMDYESYYVLFETSGLKKSIKYEENTPENDQIWSEWVDNKKTGTYVFKSDYSSGVYTDYVTQQESYIKKRD